MLLYMVIMFILSDGNVPMLAQCCTSDVDGGPALNLHLVIVLWLLLNRHNRLNQRWFNVGPPSTTLDQRYTNID